MKLCSFILTLEEAPKIMPELDKQSRKIQLLALQHSEHSGIAFTPSV